MISEELVLPQATNPARDQGQRPTCIAFALTEVELVAAPGLTALSPEYLYHSAALQTLGWIPNAGVPLGAALVAAAAGQPAEDDFPYQPVEPTPPLSPLPTSLSTYGIPIRYFSIDIDHIVQLLRSGMPVGLGLQLSDSFYRPWQGIVAFEPLIRPGVLHAVTAVGLGWSGGEAHFLARNSWGAGWGVSGNAWLSAKYIQAHGVCAFGESP
jgi:hypothetical protein